MASPFRCTRRLPSRRVERPLDWSRIGPRWPPHTYIMRHDGVKCWHLRDSPSGDRRAARRCLRESLLGSSTALAWGGGRATTIIVQNFWADPLKRSVVRYGYLRLDGP